ncbi:MAG TPA: sigma-70 family RNA polymerase sigma factor [Tepidisphaeraceae bacterium]|jgi:RNA polymerase sigma-70 factor (ECF subfamily)|nr:sigma-70 family RNA polymerase sigma factor [Tepidisphaeraceae bacterium]
MNTAAFTPRPALSDADTTLERRLALGETGAFEQVVALYQPRVSRLAFRLLGWKGDVEDVVQDVFVIALSKGKSFRGDASLWTWLTAVTLNLCRTRLRRAALLRRLTGGMLRLESGEEAPADSTAMIDETGRSVRRAVASLPPRDREVIVLYYLEERSAAEVAELLGITANTVDVRLYRARQKLKALLGEFDTE